MLGQVLKKYQSSKKTTQKTLQSLKQTIEEHLETKTIQALKIQNHKVSKIHSNQQEIQNRLRRNNQLQGQLKIHLGGWVLLYDELNKALKEAGDVAHYARYVQEQIKQINQQLTLRMSNDKNDNNIIQQKRTLESKVNQQLNQSQIQQKVQIKPSNTQISEQKMGEIEKKEQVIEQFFDVEV